MPLSREVFEQDGVSGAELPGGAIDDICLGEENGVLPAGALCQSLKRPLGERVKVILLAACSIDLSMSGGSRLGPQSGLTIRAGITSDKRHGHSSWGPSEGSEVHRALPLYCRADYPGTQRPAHPPGACPDVPAGFSIIPACFALESQGKMDPFPRRSAYLSDWYYSYFLNARLAAAAHEARRASTVRRLRTDRRRAGLGQDHQCGGVHPQASCAPAPVGAHGGIGGSEAGTP